MAILVGAASLFARSYISQEKCLERPDPETFSRASLYEVRDDTSRKQLLGLSICRLQPGLELSRFESEFEAVTETVTNGCVKVFDLRTPSTRFGVTSPARFYSVNNRVTEIVTSGDDSSIEFSGEKIFDLRTPFNEVCNALVQKKLIRLRSKEPTVFGYKKQRLCIYRGWGSTKVDQISLTTEEILKAVTARRSYAQIEP